MVFCSLPVFFISTFFTTTRVVKFFCNLETFHLTRILSCVRDEVYAVAAAANGCFFPLKVLSQVFLVKLRFTGWLQLYTQKDAYHFWGRMMMITS